MNKANAKYKTPTKERVMDGKNRKKKQEHASAKIQLFYNTLKDAEAKRLSKARASLMFEGRMLLVPERPANPRIYSDPERTKMELRFRGALKVTGGV